MPKEVQFQGLPGGPVLIEFSDNIPHWCTCSKCHMVSLSMYVDQKGHVFCATCVDRRSQEQTIFCDHEKRDIHFQEMDEAFSVITALKCMAVYCPNKKQGCTTVSSLANLQEHFLSCKRTHLTCGFCGKHFPGPNYEDHTKSCSEKPVQCSYCYKAQRRGSLQEHKKVCGKQEEVCRKCNRNILRMKFAVHEYQCTGNPNAKSQIDAGVTDKVSSAVVDAQCDVMAAVTETPTMSCNPSSMSGNDMYNEETRMQHEEVCSAKKMVSSAVVDSESDVMTAAIQPPTMSCNPSSMSGNDMYNEETGMQHEEVCSAKRMVDPETQTSHLPMSGEDIVQSALHTEIMMNVMKLPLQEQHCFNTLLEHYIMLKALATVPTSTENFLGLHFQPLSKESENETGMQKTDKDVMSQDEYREKALATVPTSTKNFLGQHFQPLSKQSENETGMQKTDKDVMSQDEYRERALAAVPNKASTENFLGQHFQPLSKQSENETGMQKTDKDVMSQDEYRERALATVPNQASTDNFLGQFQPFSKQSENETLMQKTDEDVMSLEEYREQGSRHDLKDDTHVRLESSSPWEILSGSQLSSPDTTCSENAGYAGILMPEMVKQSLSLLEAQDIADDKCSADANCSQDDCKCFDVMEQSHAEVMLPQDSTATNSFGYTSSIQLVKGNVLHTELLSMDVLNSALCSMGIQQKGAAPSTTGFTQDPSSGDASWCSYQMERIPSEPHQEYKNKTLFDGIRAMPVRHTLLQNSEQSSCVSMWRSTWKEQAEHKETEKPTGRLGDSRSEVWREQRTMQTQSIHQPCPGAPAKSYQPPLLQKPTFIGYSGDADSQSIEVIQSPPSGDYHVEESLHNSKLPHQQYNDRPGFDRTSDVPAGHVAIQTSWKSSIFAPLRRKKKLNIQKPQ